MATSNEPAAASSVNKWRLTAVLFFAYGFAVLVPWVSIQYPNELDTSWNLVIHRAFIQHEVFGRDIVYTAGPWGILYAGYDPATFPYVIGGWIVLAAAALLPLYRIARGSSSSPLSALAWGIVVAGTMSIALRDVFFLTLPVLLLVAHFLLRERNRSVSRVLLVFALSLSTAVKFSFAVAAVLAIAIITIDELRRRRFPTTVVLFGLFIPLVWLLALQPVDAIPDYLRTSAEISSGYAPAMAMTASAPMLPAWLFLVCAAAIVALVLAAPLDRDLIAAGLLAAGLAALFFVLAKAGYVRHDIHAVIPEVAIFIIAAVTCAALPLRRPYLRVARNSLLSVSFLVAVVSCQLNADPLWTYLAHGPRDPINAEGHFLSPRQLRNDLQANLAHIASTHPIRRESGTADVYGNAQAALLASGNFYQHRPVFQSLVVYTSKLAAINAAHLQTSRAADTIFFDLSPIDGRFPALEDSLSWPELLTRYRATDLSQPLLMLRREKSPRAWRVVLMSSDTITLGRVASPPSMQTGPVWATMQLRMSSLGRLASLFSRPPVIQMEVRTTAGEKHTYRVVPSLLEGGFVLSPRTTDWPSFAALQSSSWLQLTRGEEVASYRILPLQGVDAMMYEPRVSVSYYRLMIQPAAVPFPDPEGFRALRDRIQRRLANGEASWR